MASVRQVGSLGLTLAGSLDVDLFNRWIADFLRENSANLFRSKGVLSFENQERKWVFQVRTYVCACLPACLPPRLIDFCSGRGVC